MKTFKASLTEATKSQVVVSFGRMNPMTNGHEKLPTKSKQKQKSVTLMLNCIYRTAQIQKKIH